MRWSFPIARAAGIPVYVHATFLLLLLWAAWKQYSYRHDWADAAIGVVFVLVLFLIIVLHEFGHALTARRFGVHTRDIVLLPIGGVARLERMPDHPSQELLVALAGPAVNLCLAVFFFAIIGGSAQISHLTQARFDASEIFGVLMWVNVVLAAFNMIPAFPMDGGRALRAFLAMRFSYVTATRTAALIGKGLALGFIVLGLLSLASRPVGHFSNPFLLLIGLFVWIGATQEAGIVELKSALKDLVVADLMTTNFRVIGGGTSLAAVGRQFASEWQDFYPVVEQDRVVGLLDRVALLSGLSIHGAGAQVQDVMVKHYEVLAPEDPADMLLRSLRRQSPGCTLVFSDRRLVGLVTQARVREFLRLYPSFKPLPPSPPV